MCLLKTRALIREIEDIEDKLEDANEEIRSLEEELKQATRELSAHKAPAPLDLTGLFVHK
jgi:predicted  nucleic acid-binding Zn-ribbon protein